MPGICSFRHYIPYTYKISSFAVKAEKDPVMVLLFK